MCIRDRSDTVNVGVIDGGCPRTVAGRAWLTCFKDALQEKSKFKTVPSNEQFKFGPSKIFTATEKVTIPIKLGSKHETLECCIIPDCDIPLLISKKTLSNWGALEDHRNRTLTIDHRGWKETIQLKELPGGHAGLDLSGDNQIDRCFLVDNDTNKGTKLSYSRVRKIHRVLGHAKEANLTELFKNKGQYSSKLNKIIRRVCSECKVCLKYRRNTSRPAVGMPKASTANQVVSVDLKNVSSLLGKKSDKRYILYLTDEFTRYIKGKVLNNKEAGTVVKAMVDTWGLDWAGLPSRGFHADNGSEFSNQELRALCQKRGINLTLNPAYSPFSNGGNERRHASVDQTISLMLEENPQRDLQEVLTHACHARNQEMGPLGFSPGQITFGTGDIVSPGIIDGNVTTDQNITGSQAVNDFMFKRLSAQRNFS